MESRFSLTQKWKALKLLSSYKCLTSVIEVNGHAHSKHATVEPWLKTTLVRRPPCY